MKPNAFSLFLTAGMALLLPSRFQIASAQIPQQPALAVTDIGECIRAGVGLSRRSGDVPVIQLCDTAEEGKITLEVRPRLPGTYLNPVIDKSSGRPLFLGNVSPGSGS